MTDELSIPPDNGIYSPKALGDGGQLIKISNDGFLKGNRHIESVPGVGFEERFQFLWLFFKEFVGIIS